MSENIINFYKYGNNFHYLTDFCEQKVWLSPIRELNDPFENRYCSQHPDPAFILQTPVLYEHYFQCMADGNPSYTEDDFKKFLKSEEVRTEIEGRKYQDNQFMDFGVLSLTTNANNIPMWAYYANNHERWWVGVGGFLAWVWSSGDA